MSKFKNDSFYENKFCCFKAEYAEKCLTEAELSILSVLLQKIEKNYPNREYLVVNQDEPYADKVWGLIKEGEKEKAMSKYIVKNCPAYGECCYSVGECQDCTDCVMKQIVELCKSDCIDCSSTKRVTYTQCKDLNNCKTAKILKLLDIEEVK